MVHRESSHTCWKERNCGRRSSLQGVCAKGVDSRMEELLSHQTQEAGRFANRTGVLLAEIEVGSGKPIADVLNCYRFSLYGTQVCYQYLRCAIYFIRGIRGCPLTRWDFVR